MSSKVRFIDLGAVPPETFSSMWEVDRILDITEPTIFKWTADRLVCHFWDGPHFVVEGMTTKLDPHSSSGELKSWKKGKWAWIKSDLGPIFTASYSEPVQFMRCIEPTDGPINQRLEETDYENDDAQYKLWSGGFTRITSSLYPRADAPENNNGGDPPICYYTEDKSVANWILLLPNEDNRVKVDTLMFASLQKILKEKGIMTKMAGNDLYYEESSSGVWKKFVGSLFRRAEKNMSYNDFGVTWHFNRDITNEIRAVASGSSGLQIKKFDVADLGTVVTGFNEYTGSITQSIVRSEIESAWEQLVCSELDLVITNDTLTSAESKSLYEVGDSRLTDDNWSIRGDNAGHPESLIT